MFHKHPKLFCNGGGESHSPSKKGRTPKPKEPKNDSNTLPT